MNKNELKIIEDYANCFLLNNPSTASHWKKVGFLFKNKMIDMFSKDPIDWNISFEEFNNFLILNNGFGKDFKTIFFKFSNDVFEKTGKNDISANVFDVIKNKGFVEHCNSLSVNDCLELNRKTDVLYIKHSLFKNLLASKIDFTLNPFSNINHEIEKLYIDNEHTLRSVENFLIHPSAVKNLYESLHWIKDKVHPSVYERHIIGSASIFKSHPDKFTEFYNEFKPDLDYKAIVKNNMVFSLKDLICIFNTPEIFLGFSSFLKNNGVVINTKQCAKVLETVKNPTSEKGESDILKLRVLFDTLTNNREYKKNPTRVL